MHAMFCRHWLSRLYISKDFKGASKLKESVYKITYQ